MSKPSISDDYVDLGLGEGLLPGALPSKKQIMSMGNENIKPGNSVFQLNRRNSLCKKSESMEDADDCHSLHKQGVGNLNAPALSLANNNSNNVKNNWFNTKKKATDSSKELTSTTPSHFLDNTSLSAGCFADVSLGTSLRQQRELFEYELGKVLVNQDPHDNTVKCGEIKGKKKGISEQSLLADVDKELLEKKLQQTKLEVEVLKQDLELCQRHLDAKYKAIKIMQGQAYAIHKEDENESNKVKTLNQRLQEEINKLQFEMDCKESSLTSSQVTWAERFDRMCQDNVTLVSALEEKNLEMKKLHAEKITIARERDELLALVDIQERQRFESLRNSTDDSTECFNTFSSIELAVLGACHCRGPSLEPCNCAQAAAKLKQEVTRLKSKISEHVKWLEDSSITTDTYRIAFEEQLSRNRDLIKRFAEMTAAPQMTRAEKAKAAIKWLIKQLNEEEYERTKGLSRWQLQVQQHETKEHSESDSNHATGADSIPPSMTSQFRSDIEELFASIPEDTSTDLNCTPSSAAFSHDQQHLTQNNLEMLKQQQQKDSLKESENHLCSNDQAMEQEELSRLDKYDLQSKSDTELIDVLADMIADKSEALAHQRLTSKLLAKRNKELEEQLTSLTEGDEVFLSTGRKDTKSDMNSIPKPKT